MGERSHKCVAKQSYERPRSAPHFTISFNIKHETRRALIYNLRRNKKRAKNVKKINLMMCQGVKWSSFHSGKKRFEWKLDDGRFAQRNFGDVKWTASWVRKTSCLIRFPPRKPERITRLRSMKLSSSNRFSSEANYAITSCGSRVTFQNEHEHWMWPISHQHKTSTVN